jgi:hypothetical protein
VVSRFASGNTPQLERAMPLARGRVSLNKNGINIAPIDCVPFYSTLNNFPGNEGGLVVS